MSKINKRQIQDNSVDSNIVEDESLTGADIQDDSLTDADLATTAGIQLSKLNSTGAVNRSAIYHNGTTWVPFVKEYLDIYDSTGGQSFIGTITVDLDTTRENSNTSVFSITSGEITVSKTGTFLVSYVASLDVTENTRTNSLSYLELDTGTGYSIVPGTNGYGYHMTAVNGENTASGNCILDLTSGDKLKLTTTQVIGGTLSTLAGGSSIVIIEQ